MAVQELTASEIVKMIRANKLKSPLVSSACLSFLHTCLQKPFGETVKLATHHALPCILEIITLTDDKSLKNPATMILQMLVKKNEHEITEILKIFVASNMAFNSERVFLTLKVVTTMNSSIMIALISDVEEEVCKIENKRGSGKDIKLRKLLEDLILTVQKT